MPQRRASGLSSATSSPTSASSPAVVVMSYQPAGSGTPSCGPIAGPLVRECTYRAMTVRLPAMPARSTGVHCRRRTSSAYRTCAAPHATKKAPCAHHSSKCGLATPKWAMPEDRDRQAAKASTPGARRLGGTATPPRTALVVIAVTSLVPGRRGLDGVAGVVVERRADPVLAHHVVVLVDEVVAVDHVPALVGAELHDDLHRLALADVGDVLRAELVGSRRPAVAAEDL